MEISHRSKDGGFSLVELLVTVVIIAVLAAIAIPVYNSQRNRAHKSAAQQDARAAVLSLNTGMMGYTDMGSTMGQVGVAGTVGTVTLYTWNLTGSVPSADAFMNSRFSDGTSLSGNFETGPVSAMTGGVVNYCIIVLNNGQKVIANEAGLTSFTGGCNNGTAS